VRPKQKAPPDIPFEILIKEIGERLKDTNLKAYSQSNFRHGFFERQND
jgi:hypothetical protein